MADNLCPMAWLFLQENVQVQYLQKIALRAKNPSGPKYVKVKANFLHEVQFSAAIEAAHFPAVFEMQPCLHSKKGPHSWGRP